MRISTLISSSKSVESLSILAALLALTLLLFSSYPSSGIVRGDDDGSGIGGTGRQAVPGSGLGGTGLKPYLGLNSDNEIEILQSVENRESTISVSLPIDFATSESITVAKIDPQFRILSKADTTRDSSAISIAKSIQRNTDTNAAYYSRLHEISRNMSAEGAEGTAAGEGIERSRPISIMASNSASNLPIIEENTVAAIKTPGSSTVQPVLKATDLEPIDSQTEVISWTSLARFLGSRMQTSSTSSAAAVHEIKVIAEELHEVARPARIQRPELPPRQRLRPIQRASLLPPRIKPLRL